MEIDPKTLKVKDAYALLIAVVVPRPVAWASTLDASGRANLAPFSFFGGVTSDPLTVMVSVGRRKGVKKDTAANLLATRPVPFLPRSSRLHFAADTMANFRNGAAMHAYHFSSALPSLISARR